MNQTQRILFLTPNMERGEIGDYIADLSKYLQNQKGLPVVISAGGYETLRLRRNGITHIQAPLHSINPFSILKSLSEIDAAVKKYQINLIHVHSRLTAFLARYIAKRYSIPVVATTHYSYGLSQKRVSWIERLKMTGIQHATHVITSFRYLKNILIQATDIKEKNISHVSRWVDTNHFSPENISAERLISLTEKWNVPDGLPLILNISEESEANDCLFLEAISKLSHRNFCVLMVRNWASGKSPHKSRIERKAQELNLYKNLSIVLPEDDEPLMYKLSDLIICPSHTSFARIALQAQIMGRPILLPAVQGASDFVRTEQTGYIFLPTSVKSLTEALSWGLNLSLDERAKFVKNGYDFAKEYEKERILPQIINIYNTLIFKA